MKAAYYPYVHTFLKKVFTIVDRESSKPYNFIAYKYKVEIIVDFIKKIDIEKIPILILDFIIDQFDVVSRYIGHYFGDSWYAQDYWDNNKRDIDKRKLEIVLDRIDKINTGKQHYISLKAINLIKEAIG